jgi:hypothetical protein
MPLPFRNRRNYDTTGKLDAPNGTQSNGQRGPALPAKQYLIIDRDTVEASATPTFRAGIYPSLLNYVASTAILEDEDIRLENISLPEVLHIGIEHLHAVALRNRLTRRIELVEGG